MNKDTLRAAVEEAVKHHLHIVKDYDGLVENIVSSVLGLLPPIDNEAAFDKLLGTQDYPGACDHDFDCISFEIVGRGATYRCRHCFSERKRI